MNRQLLEYHSTIGFRFIPGLSTREEHEGGGFLLRTNQSGYRSPHEFKHQKTPGTRRVLLFGDSYTAGMGVSDGNRYSEVLEELIPALEVYNFGMPGSGTDQQYLIHREDAREIECDVVIIAVMVENILRTASRYRKFGTLEGDELAFAKPYYTLNTEGALVLHHVPVPKEPLVQGEASGLPSSRFAGLREVVNKLGPQVKQLAQRVSRFQPLPAYDHADDPDWLVLKAILTQWVGELDVPAVIVPIPLYQYVEKTASAEAYQARFRELESLEGVVVHDPLPDFHRYSPDERRGFRFPYDCHLTRSAHRVLAESLAKRLEPMLAADPAN